MRFGRQLRTICGLAAVLGATLLTGPAAPAAAEPETRYAYAFDDRDKDLKERAKRKAENERERHKREAESARERQKRQAERERERAKKVKEWAKERRERGLSARYRGRSSREEPRVRVRPAAHALGDYDRDGIPNGKDRDMDGDGVTNTRDRYPTDRRRR